MGRSRKLAGCLSAAVAGVVLGVVAPAASGQDEPVFTRIALTGESAPGTTLLYREFSAPTINVLGQVAFHGSFGTADAPNTEWTPAIWAGLPEGINLAAAVDGDAPGTEDPAPLQFALGFGGNRVGLANTGDLIFYGTLNSGNTTNDNGIWIGPVGGLKLLAREDDETPITDIGSAPFPDGNTTPPRFNNNLGSAYIGPGGYGGFSSAITLDVNNSLNEFSLFGGTAGSTDALAVAGRQVFGETSGEILYRNVVVAPRLNTFGQSAFVAGMKGADAPGAQTAVFVGAPGDAAIAAATGRLAPGFNVAEDVRFTALYQPDLNEDSQIAFVAGMSNYGGSDLNPARGEAVYFGSIGSLAVAAGIGDSVNVPEFVYSEFLTLGPIINDAGQIVFAAMLQTGASVNSANDMVIVAGSAGNPDDLLIVAREGQVTLGEDELLPGFTLQDSPLINNRGDIAFYITEAGGGTSLWMSNLSGDLVRIVGTGDLFTVDEGDPLNPLDDDVREVFALKMGTNIDGYRYLSDNGSLAFGLVFEDSPGVFSEGLFTTFIPEPSSAFLALGAAGLFLRRRRTPAA